MIDFGVVAAGRYSADRRGCQSEPMASVLSDRAGPDMSGLAGADAATIAARVRDGDATAADVADAHLTRIAAVDARVGAFCSVDPERVRAEATGIDARTDRFALPLAGVPVAVEDDVALAGVPTGHGVVGDRRGDAAVRDDALVRRLRAAGAIVLGRTRTAELGVCGFTRMAPGAGDPVDIALPASNPCGAGAAAVAAGMTALALGRDGGGSVRLAAAWCGQVGLKPGHGTLPLPGGAEDRWFGLAETGLVARTAADVALLFEAVSTTTIGDLAAVGIPRRVAVSTASPSGRGKLDPAHHDAVRKAARRFTELGVQAVDADPPYPSGLDREWTRRWRAGVAQEAESLRIGDGELGRRTSAVVRRGRRDLRRERVVPGTVHTWRDRMAGWLDGGRYDVLVLPAVGSRAPAMRGSRAVPVPYTQAWNLAGLPALVVPVRWGAARVPVQLVGRPGSEPLLLATAACLQSL
ncbi:MAG: amidase [Pseudonocardiaceae bacterium]|nr:MAG: amidase [Pseudonocardiaceae bacterium]